MEESQPKYLIIMITLVVGLVIAMYVMSNVYHIEAYPPRRHYTSSMTKRPKPPEEAAIDTVSVLKEQPIEESMPESTEIEESQPQAVASMSSGDPESYFEAQLSDYISEFDPILSENRSDIVIRYYPHKGDGDKVYRLRELGLYIHERETNESIGQYESNSIYYGDSISTRDIQVIAYYLIKNGVPIKQIVPSKYHSDWKSKSVEIGADLTLEDKLVISLEELRSFQNEFR